MELIYTKEYALWVDKEAKIKQNDWFYHPNKALVNQIEQANSFQTVNNIIIINNLNNLV